MILHISLSGYHVGDGCKSELTAMVSFFMNSECITKYEVKMPRVWKLYINKGKCDLFCITFTDLFKLLLCLYPGFIVTSCGNSAWQSRQQCQGHHSMGQCLFWDCKCLKHLSCFLYYYRIYLCFNPFFLLAKIQH